MLPFLLPSNVAPHVAQCTRPGSHVTSAAHAGQRRSPVGSLTLAQRSTPAKQQWVR